MRLKNFFLHTTRDVSQETKLASHKLMIKSGMIRQLSSGVYSWLPLGVMVLQNVQELIKKELNLISAHETILPTLQPVDLWQKTGRASSDNALGSQILHVSDSKKHKYVLPASGEEVMTALVASCLKSYKDLGKVLYQITWKFRDEIRPRHGVMRAKEFLMKDAYSFDSTELSALQKYEEVFKVYLNIFKKLNLLVIPVAAPTGAMGGDYSHEFHILSPYGESKIFYEKKLLEFLSNISDTKTPFSLKKFDQFYSKEEEKHLFAGEKNIVSNSSIEVGHMFYLGDKYTKALSCTYQNKNDEAMFPFMCCYGIGVTRLIGAIIESNHDEKGIVWPAAISPFKVALINCKVGDTVFCDQISEKIYHVLNDLGIKVLYDDVDRSVGKKFADMDLIGIPLQVIIGPKYANKKQIEIKERSTGKIKICTYMEFLSDPLFFIG